jgi:HAD superfamily hydrolase (TIGR01509 family)
MICALVFDFDGLILDTESALIRAYADVHEYHGVPFDESVVLSTIGHAGYAADPWQAFAAHHDRNALETHRRECNHARDLSLPILPGVIALMDGARERGWPVGLASNSTHDHCERHLARLGLLERFTFLACREDVPSPKPEPDMYKLVLNRFGLRGHEAIAFEDSFAGSLAAKRANMWTVVAPGPSTSHHDFGHADLRVGSLAEVTLDALVQRFEAAPR